MDATTWSDLVELRNELRTLRDRRDHLSAVESSAIGTLIAEIDAITVSPTGELSVTDEELNRLAATARLFRARRRVIEPVRAAPRRGELRVIPRSVPARRTCRWHAVYSTRPLGEMGEPVDIGQRSTATGHRQAAPQPSR